MKAFLMHRDRDLDLDRELPSGWEALVADLGLATLFEAMAAGDPLLEEVARKAVLSSLPDPEDILYRQRVLADCLARPAVVRQIFDLAGEAVAGEKKVYLGLLRRSPDTLLSRSLQVLELFVGLLKRLRRLADEHGAAFRSQGFRRFFSMLQKELDDDYLRAVERHLRELAFRQGVLMRHPLPTFYAAHAVTSGLERFA